MPFDGVDFDFDDEVLSTLQKVRTKINRYNWCKGEFVTRNCACLIGQINLVQGNEDRQDQKNPVVKFVTKRLPRHYGSIVSFNDDVHTRVADVHNLLDKCIEKRREEIIKEKA